jgi:predicted dehydrogenase
MTVSVGYVGLDHHHRAPYVDSIAHLERCEVVATADPYGSTAAEVGADSFRELPHYDSTESLVESEDVDVVWLTVANRETPTAIEAALEGGADVYTEKPGARTAAELEPISDRIRRADDSTVCFSYPWRAHPVAEELRARAKSGFFGDVRSFDLRFIASKLSARPTDHYLFDWDASRGGIVQWLGVHWVDLVPWILGDRIHRVNATMSNRHGDVDTEDGATIQLELADSGAVGTHSTGYYLREGRYDTEIKIYGEEGRCTWDPVGDVFGFDDQTSLRLDSDEWSSTPVRTLTYEYESVPGYGGSWGLSFFEQFLDAREGTADVPADIDDALRVLTVLDAAYESAETGEWVTVDDPSV